MREIIHLQLGLCGNQIGNQFWQTVAEEHGLDPNGVFHAPTGSPQAEIERMTLLQTERLNVYFDEGPTGNYVPR